MLMVPTIKTIRKRHGLLVRGVAVFFVLFAFADIVFPEYCREAVARTPIESRASVIVSSSEEDGTQPITVTFFSSESRQDQPTESAPHEGDCLGCCAHVLPVTIFTKVSIPELKSPSIQIETSSLPTSPLRSPYHPPRLA